MEVRDGGCRLEQYSRLALWIGRSLCFRTETGLGYVFVQKVLEDYLPPDRPSSAMGNPAPFFIRWEASKSGYWKIHVLRLEQVD